MDEILDQNNEEPEPAPDVVTKQDLATVVDALNKQTQMLSDRIEDAINRQTSSPRTVVEPDDDDVELTDDDEGDTRTAKIVAKGMRPLRKQVEALARLSVGTMEKISQRQVAPTLKYYERFKKEVNAKLATLTPDMRAQPEAMETAYKLVLTEHVDELVEEEINARARADATGGAKPGAPGTARRTVAKQTESVPTPAELGFTADQDAAIQARGGWDAWARRMSGGRYKGYADYAKAHAKIRERAATTQEAA